MLRVTWSRAAKGLSAQVPGAGPPIPLLELMDGSVGDGAGFLRGEGSNRNVRGLRSEIRVIQRCSH